MQIEREKKYRIDNFDCAVLERLGIEPLHLKQYYLKLNNYVKGVINYYHGPDVEKIAKEVRVRVVKGLNTEKFFEFTVKGSGNIVRQESEVLIAEDVARNLINNYADSMVEKVRYKIQGLHVVEINKFLDRNLVLAEVEYDGDAYTEEDIDEEVCLVVSKFVPNANIVDVTYDSKYKNKNLAIPVKKSDYKSCSEDMKVNEEVFK